MSKCLCVWWPHNTLCSAPLAYQTRQPPSHEGLSHVIAIDAAPPVAVIMVVVARQRARARAKGGVVTEREGQIHKLHQYTKVVARLSNGADLDVLTPALDRHLVLVGFAFLPRRVAVRCCCPPRGPHAATHGKPHRARARGTCTVVAPCARQGRRRSRARESTLERARTENPAIEAGRNKL